MLAHGRWFSPGTPASSTTKTGRHDIAEILLKLALNTNQSINQSINHFRVDNGGQVLEGGNNWPLRGWKRSLWEGGIHGIGFVHGQMIKKRGRISRELIHVSDWFPTLINLAGGSLDGTNRIDGLDQWNTIRLVITYKYKYHTLLSSPLVFSGVRVPRSFVLCEVFWWIGPVEYYKVGYDV